MKKILRVLLFALIGGLAWYFFINPYDYRVRFTSNTFPGAINQTIKTWNKSLGAGNTIEQSEDITTLVQHLIVGDSTHTYEWTITPMTDSTSAIKVGIKDKEHSFANRLAIPFTETALEQASKKRLLDFNEVLTEHIKNFAVTINGEEELATTFCACVALDGPQMSKATGMMQNYNYLSSFSLQNDIELNGRPFIWINEWDRKTDHISYDFCFPIIRPNTLPEWDNISFKKFYGGNMLKATYNGNYITSDRAWYALIDYAEENDISVAAKPVEFFFSNPNMGGNEMTWKAEIFLPITSDE